MLSAPAIILLVFACLTPFVVLFGSIVYLLYFQAEEDKNRAWFAKIVVVKNNFLKFLGHYNDICNYFNFFNTI